MNDIAPGFFLVLSEGYSETINWMPFITFGKSSILDLWLGSEDVSLFSITINWGYHFEFSENLSNMISILSNYLEQKFSF